MFELAEVLRYSQNLRSYVLVLALGLCMGEDDSMIDVGRP